MFRATAPTSPTRLLTPDRYREVHDWVRESCFDALTMSERVTVVVAALIESADGLLDADDLAGALRETATVDLALDLLGRARRACA